MNKQLSEHFHLDEFTRSNTALRKGISNVPGAQEYFNIQLLCNKVLEPIRLYWNKPVIITSGFRSEKLNKAIGGATESQHIKGKAADIEIMGVDNKELFRWISNTQDIDQIILEYYKDGKTNSGWVHVSWSKFGNRNQKLVSLKDGTKTKYRLIT